MNLERAAKDYIASTEIARRYARRTILGRLTQESSQNGHWFWDGPSSPDRGPEVKLFGCTWFVTHVVLWAWKGRLGLKDKVVFRTCGEHACINPDHLKQGTQKDAQAARVARGAVARGEANGRAKLLEGDVRDIRKLLQRPDLFIKDIALEYGVDSKVIRKIRDGESWTHVE